MFALLCHAPRTALHNLLSVSQLVHFSPVLLSLSQRFQLDLTRGYINVLFKAKLSLVSCSLPRDQLWVPVLVTIPYKKKRLC